jgi:hypothetical protein
MVAKTILESVEVSDADREGIVAAALDYIEGWYNAAPDQTERSLHPHLAKRRVATEAGRDRLDQMSAMELVHYMRAKAERGDITAEDQRVSGIKVLDVFGNAATLRLDMADWIDYVHLAKINGEWKIVNVLWAMREG